MTDPQNVPVVDERESPHAVLLRTVKAALPALEQMSFDEVVDELIFLAVDACEPESRVGAIGRALVTWALEDDIENNKRDAPYAAFGE